MSSTIVFMLNTLNNHVHQNNSAFFSGEGSDLQIYNVIDVPGGVVPVTTVTRDDLSKMDKYPKSNEAYQDIHKVYKT